MRYMGGKTRLGKEISSVLKQYAPSDKVKGYLEPFCGSLGVAIHMVDDYHCTVSDIHKDLIMLWKEIKSGKFRYPPSISKEKWLKYKVSNPSAMRGFIGFSCSYGGNWYNGYAPDYSSDRNPLNEGIKSLRKKEKYIKKINKIQCKSYDKWEPEGLLIYCDPPYKDTSSYSIGNFDCNKFWNIMRKWSKNNVVIISEFKAPKDFKCIWKRKRNLIIQTRNHNKTNTEKLFVIRA